MAQLELTATTLIVQVRGMDKVWALTSRLEIPLAHIADATVDSAMAREGPQGLRLPGTDVPGVIAAGTFFQADGRVFWDVHNPANAIVIHLHDDHYRGLVIEVDDPQAAVGAITRAALALRTA